MNFLSMSRHKRNYVLNKVVDLQYCGEELFEIHKQILLNVSNWFWLNLYTHIPASQKFIQVCLLILNTLGCQRDISVSIVQLDLHFPVRQTIESEILYSNSKTKLHLIIIIVKFYILDDAPCICRNKNPLNHRKSSRKLLNWVVE